MYAVTTPHQSQKILGREKIPRPFKRSTLIARRKVRNEHQKEELIQLQLKGGGTDGWCIAMAIANAMRDTHYTNKTIRISDEVWLNLKSRRERSNKSWNIFLRDLIGFKPDRPQKKK